MNQRTLFNTEPEPPPPPLVDSWPPIERELLAALVDANDESIEPFPQSTLEVLVACEVMPTPKLREKLGRVIERMVEHGFIQRRQAMVSITTKGLAALGFGGDDDNQLGHTM